MFGKEPAGRLVSRWTVVNGLRTHMLVSANRPRVGGEPVVLVPGLNVGSAHQAPLAQLLAPYFKVYSPDLPGYGGSQAPKGLMNERQMVDFLADWMRAQGIERADILGTSFSAQLVAWFAKRHAGMVARAILVSPEVDPKSRFVPKLIWLWWVNRRREPKYVGVDTAASYKKVGKLRAIWTFWLMLRTHLEDLVPAIRVPAMVVHGSRDVISSSHWAKRLADLMPCAWMVEIPGAAHAVNMDSPRKLAIVVRTFLEVWRMGRVGWRTRRAAVQIMEWAEHSS